MNRKILKLSLLSILLVAVLMPFALAYESLYIDNSTYYSYTSSYTNNYIMVYKQAGGNAEYVSRASMYIKNDSNLIGNFYGYVFENSTTVANLVEVSSATDAATVNSWTWVTVEFADTSYLNASRNYWIGLGFNGTGSFSVGRAAPNTGETLRSTNGGATWGYQSGSTSWMVTVYTDDGSGPATPVPTAPGEVEVPTSLDGVITSLTAILVPLMVMLLPSAILWWFGGRGKWPLLIGLAIGTGLGYVFVAGFPLWLVFLVAIGIIGMAYSDVSSGGSYT